MIAVDFLRHGRTETPGRLLGRTDAPLSAEGLAAVARQVQGRAWSAIVTSPLNRARETAAIAAGASGAPVEITPDWQEIDFGAWDGEPLATLAYDPRFAAFQADAETNPPPGGEPMHDARTRITRALEALATRASGPVLVVAHGGAIRVALSVLLALPFERLWAVRIGCATRITVEMGRSASHGLWGEIVEIAQPASIPATGKENE